MEFTDKLSEMYRPRRIPLQFPRYTDAKDIKREIEEIRQRVESNTMMNMDIQKNVIAEIDRLRQDNMDMAAILDREEIFYGHTNIYEEVTRLRCMNLRLKAIMDLQQMDDISKRYKKPSLRSRSTPAESTHNGSKQQYSRLSTGTSNNLEQVHSSHWAVEDDLFSEDKNSNMNSVRDSPSETEEMLFTVHPKRSPSGTIVAYDVPEDVAGMDLYGCLDERNIRVHVEPIRQLYIEDIPHRDIVIEEVEIRDYSSKSLDKTTWNSVEEQESSLAVTDIPNDEDNYPDIPNDEGNYPDIPNDEDNYLDIPNDEDKYPEVPFTKTPSTDQERPRGFVSDSDITRMSKNYEQDLVAIVEQHRHADYIESCRTTMQLCSVIIEMCISKIGNTGQGSLTQSFSTTDDLGHSIPVHVPENGQRPYEEARITKDAVHRENEPVELSSLEVTDIIEDVIGNRHLPIPFKLIPYGHWRPKCVPKLDLTGLASESDIDVAKISGYDISWLYPDPVHDNDASENPRTQPSHHHEIYSTQTLSQMEKHESALAMTRFSEDEDRRRDIPFTLVSSPERDITNGVPKFDLRDMVSGSDINIARVNQNTQPELAANVVDQRYADYIESCKTTIQLCSVIIEKCVDKIGNTWKEAQIPKDTVSRENEPAESSSLGVTDIIEDVIGNRHLPIPFKLIPYGHWRPKCVPKLDLTGLASESDIDVAKISGCDISWLFPDSNGVTGKPTKRTSGISKSRNSDMSTVHPIAEHALPLAMTNFTKDKDAHLDIKVSKLQQGRPDPVIDPGVSDIHIPRVHKVEEPELVVNVEDQRYVDYIESCKETIHLCNVIIEKCMDKISNTGKEDSKISPIKTNTGSAGKERHMSMTSPNKRSIERSRVHFRDVDSVISDQGDVPCLDLSLEVPSIRPVREGQVIKEFLNSDDESPGDTSLDSAPELPLAGLENDDKLNDMPGGSQLVEIVEDDERRFNLNMSAITISDYEHQIRKCSYGKIQDRTWYNINRDPGDVKLRSRY